jgi:hypothetical protein
VEWQAGGLYPKMPPKVEAMTMPKITQQMIITIFFCKEEGPQSEGAGRGAGEGQK